MITLYIYSTINGSLLYIDTGSVDAIVRNIAVEENFTLTPPPDYDHVWRWLDTEWVELLPINNPDIPYSATTIWDAELGQWVESPELLAYKHLESQALMWERIKQLRIDKMTSGVYVESIDKHLHSDEVSSIQYAQIGTAISLGMFAPMNWKAMDGDFIELTEPIFRELQVAMIVNTQTIYAKAEYHKYMMMQSDDPLSYDYNEGW